MLLLKLVEALGGLGLFVLGMKTMADGLQKLSGGGVRRCIEVITGNRISAALAGGSLSIILQSSGAASILIIGFVNAGLLSLYQALAMLIGTGIGTTIAVQFFAFKITFLALPSIFFGVFLRFFTRRRRLAFLGEVLLGFGLLFFGLEIMESRFAALTGNSAFQDFHAVLVNLRLAGVASGALLTFLVQSGSAALGVVIALAASGSIGFEQAVAMTLGEIIGTAALAGIGAISGTPAARRTVLFFTIVSVVSAGVALLLFPLFLCLVAMVTPGDTSFIAVQANGQQNVSLIPAARADVARAIANSHTVFSVLSALLFLPTIGFLARSAARALPETNSDTDMDPHARYLDFRVIDTPSLAFVQAGSELKRMAKVANSMVGDSVRQFSGFDARTESRIRQRENLLDVLQKDLSSFLVALAREPLSPEAAAEVPVLLDNVNDLEGIGDDCEVILECLRRKKEENVYFSDTAMEEIASLAKGTETLMAAALDCLDHDERPELDGNRVLKEELRRAAEILKGNHLERLSTGECSVIAGLLFMDIIAAFVRIGETAFAIMEARRNLIDGKAPGLD